MKPPCPLRGLTVLALLWTGCPALDPLGAPDGGSEGPPCAAGPFALVEIQPGTFTLGSPASEVGRFANEDERQVTLTHGYCIGATEVTQGQFEEVMGSNPSLNTQCGADCPVERVTWHLAAEYANRLSVREKLQPCYTCVGGVCEDALNPYLCDGYRLPTEAEWEGAARAGARTAFQHGVEIGADLEQQCPADAGLPAESGIELVAWTLCTTSPVGIRPVAKLAPNAWGLYDVSGNVWEWCHDDYILAPVLTSQNDPVGRIPPELEALNAGVAPGEFKEPDAERTAILASSPYTVRGGSHVYYPRYARLAYRAGGAANLQFEDLGLRIARTIP